MNAISFLLLSFLVLGLNAEERFLQATQDPSVCQTDDSDFIPDLNDDTIFYQCVINADGVTYSLQEQSCAPGTIFDVTQSTTNCVWNGVTVPGPTVGSGCQWDGQQQPNPFDCFSYTVCSGGSADLSTLSWCPTGEKVDYANSDHSCQAYSQWWSPACPPNAQCQTPGDDSFYTFAQIVDPSTVTTSVDCSSTADGYYIGALSTQSYVGCYEDVFAVFYCCYGTAVSATGLPCQ